MKNKITATISHYLSVYMSFASTSFAKAMDFRLNFILLIILDICFYSTTLASVDILYDHVTTIGPWKRDQLMFFLSFMLFIDYLHMSLVSESFWQLSFKVRTGELDFEILKPISILFSVFFRYVRPSGVPLFFVTSSILIYHGLKVELSLFNWIILPILIFLSFTLRIILEFAIATVTFWMVETISINFVRMQLQSLGRWPDFVYSSYPKRIFTTIFPILMVGSAPAHFLLEGNSFRYIFYLLACIVIFSFVLKYFWKKGLDQYDSASS